MPRVRSQRSGAEPGTSGSSSSPSERSACDAFARRHAGVVGERDVDAARGQLGGHDRDRRAPARARSPPTSGVVVSTCTSGCTCRIFAATAVTSSVDIIHVPTPNSSASQRRQRHQPQPPARESGARAAAPAARRRRPPGRPPAGRAQRCPRAGVCARVRSSRARARAARRCRWPAAAGRAPAIARVFRRACPTGSP